MRSTSVVTTATTIAIVSPCGGFRRSGAGSAPTTVASGSPGLESDSRWFQIAMILLGLYLAGNTLLKIHG